eukprot:Nk52_evm1s1916 gene=Nk52_evmTU1s1916
MNNIHYTIAVVFIMSTALLCSTVVASSVSFRDPSMSIERRGGLARLFGRKCGQYTEDVLMNQDKYKSMCEGYSWWWSSYSSCAVCNRDDQRVGPFCWGYGKEAGKDAGAAGAGKYNGYLSLKALNDNEWLGKGDTDFSTPMSETSTAKGWWAYVTYTFFDAMNCMFDAFSESWEKFTSYTETNRLEIGKNIRDIFDFLVGGLTKQVINRVTEAFKVLKAKVDNCGENFKTKFWCIKAEDISGIPPRASMGNDCTLAANTLEALIQSKSKTERDGKEYNLEILFEFVAKEAAKFIFFFTYTIKAEKAYYTEKISKTGVVSVYRLYYKFMLWLIKKLDVTGDNANLWGKCQEKGAINRVECKVVFSLLQASGLWNWVGKNLADIVIAAANADVTAACQLADAFNGGKTPEAKTLAKAIAKIAKDVFLGKHSRRSGDVKITEGDVLEDEIIRPKVFEALSEMAKSGFEGPKQTEQTSAASVHTNRRDETETDTDSYSDIPKELWLDGEEYEDYQEAKKNHPESDMDTNVVMASQANLASSRQVGGGQDDTFSRTFQAFWDLLLRFFGSFANDKNWPDDLQDTE